MSDRLEAHVHELIAQPLAPADAWRRLLDFAAETEASPLLRELRQLDISEDLVHLESWLLLTLRKSRPPKKLRAYWFGLVNIVLDNGESPSDLYVSGSTWFDEDDEEWACEPPYFPKNRYARSKVCRAIDEAEAAVGHGAIEGWELCQWYASLVVAWLCEKHFNVLRGSETDREVAVGWDSGDTIHLGTLRAEGFAPAGFKSVRVAEPSPSPTEFYELVAVDRRAWSLESPRIAKSDEELDISQEVQAGTLLRTTLEPDPFREPVDFRVTFSQVVVVSPKFGKIVAATDPEGAQLLPLQIDGAQANYFILRLLRTLPCSLEHDFSPLQLLGIVLFPRGASARFANHRQTLKGMVDANVQIFRIKDSLRTIVVRRLLKERLEDARVSGLRFVPVESSP